ncbi:esterase/lipase family protein, partial [Nocardia sp. NPDC058497]|uniref:esterase/lipase family protein n=1 Tax=Nocardia sp. NPDC058497 TaxID=3346529 RepID=UPI0036531C4A
MRRSSRSLLVVAAAALLTWATAGNAAAEYPVDYNFFGGIAPELTNPGGSLPGSNDPGCVPSAEHPNPVVLLHGTGGGAQTNWGVYAPLLANEGYCVFSLTYGAYALPWPISAIGGMRPIEQSAAEVSAFVDRVLANTGAARVDFVAHSQGNIVGYYY